MSDEEWVPYLPRVECRDFYVYIHKTPAGEPFYVGKGRGLRAYTKSDRSKGWRDVVGDGDYLVEIYRVGMTDEEARSLEAELIGSIGRKCDGSGPLVNTQINEKTFHWRRYYVVEDEAELLEALFHAENRV
ncbi:hypothetical protein [Rhodovulum sp. FJ3]|uniref:hypothetical protein n=1 Tax=Rhodovulum sp. FJ3 TaxID=3079053 RepID=UPI00293DE59C|nr:hypothetical protein [Rhodovulum sp. FJ3]MDV4167837.1 hypothetical protein [Rhodovulum sp. FJ3]